MSSAFATESWEVGVEASDIAKIQSFVFDVGIAEATMRSWG
jgi:hypothetical protein